MKNSELRIGNIITLSSPDAEIAIPSMIPFVVFEITFGRCHYIQEIGKPFAIQYSYPIEWNHVHPIPITPEWLERLGFEKNQYKYEKINLTETIYTIDVPNDYGGRIIGSDYNGEFKIRLEGCDEGKVGDFIKYIHQLQNLYHALTGQELTVKELTPSIS